MRFTSSRVVAPALFCALLFPAVAWAQEVPPPALTQEQVFAKGLPFFIASASLGDPPGTINAGQRIKARLHFVRRPGSTGGDPAVEFFFSVSGKAGGIYTNTSSRSYAYPNFPPNENEGDLTFDFTWTKPLDDAGEVSGTLQIVARPGESGAPPAALSNAIPVKLRVVK